RIVGLGGALPRHRGLKRIPRFPDDSGVPKPVDRPEPSPPAEQRPERIRVTDFDRLKSDPFAFYARAILDLKVLEPLDADHTAAWKGIAVHKALQEWLDHDECDPA